jgi:hypothetical protein
MHADKSIRFIYKKEKVKKKKNTILYYN